MSTLSYGQFNVYLQLSSARVASTSNITAQYNNGPSNNGVGASLVGTGQLVIDDVILRASERILINGQDNSYQNGVYILTVESDGNTPFVLKRSDDFQNTGSIRAGLYIPIDSGTLYSGTVWTLDEPVPNYLGIDAINFINSAGSGGGGVTPQDVQRSRYNQAQDIGVPDAYIAQLEIPMTIGLFGENVSFVPNANNTITTPTLDAGFGPRTIVKQDLSAILPDDIAGGIPCFFQFYGGNWILMNPQISGNGSVTPYQIQNNTFTAVDDSGTADAYVINLTPSPAPLNFQRFLMRTFNANTISNPTLDIGYGPTTIVKGNGLPLVAGDIASSVVADFISCGSFFYLQNPLTGVTPQDIQNNSYTYGVDIGTIDGYEIATPYVSPQDGTYLWMLPNSSNSSSNPTLTINGGTTNNIIKLVNGILNPGDIFGGIPALFLKKGTNWILINPQTEITSGAFFSGIDSGIADAYDVALNVSMNDIFGGIVYFYPQNNNTGTSTITVTSNNSISTPGAILYKNQNLTPGMIAINTPCFLYYLNGAYNLLNPANVSLRSSFAGDPNTNVAGAPLDFCIDTANSFLYYCSSPGNAASAVWTKILM